MIFGTYSFFVFIILTVSVYWGIPWSTGRLLWLLLTSISFLFYFGGVTAFVIIISLATLVYLAALSEFRFLMTLAIVVCVTVLAIFKYSHFLVDNLPLPASWGLAFLAILPATPPLAISFFTFEFIHYLSDIQRREKPVQPLRNPLHYALFVLFFPTLAAGPIKRFEQFVPELLRGSQTFTLEGFSYGLQRVGIGFFKKLVIADNFAAFIHYYDLPLLANSDLQTRWMVFISLGIRVYMDFSGYSDIAIGLAAMFGFEIPENFNRPYLASDLQDFWHRWHISLSSWIRDYIYIPIGGSRCGPIRRGFNVLLAFTLCGLWHGPHWNFVIWGLMHGLGLTMTVYYSRIPFFGPVLKTLLSNSWLSWLVTLVFVMFSWLIFFYPLDQALRFLTLLFPL